MNKSEVSGDKEKMMNNNKGVVEGEADDVVISMEKLFMELPPINPKSFIYRVPKMYRKVNETLYTPQVISIGPFHHGQQELMVAEQYKLQALKHSLSRVNMRFEEVMSMVGSWEEEARSCYEHPIDMSKQDFTRMMLLDGCFILEFTNSTNEHRHLFSKGSEKWIDSFILNGIMDDVLCDLTMYENQLPFFVLQRLYDLLSCSQNNDKDNKAFYFIECMVELFMPTASGYKFFGETTTRHLVDLLRFLFEPSAETDEYKKFKNENEKVPFLESPTITMLCESGVTIQKADKVDSIMDFSFENGVLKIPPIIINSNKFELHLRNLIASELLRNAGNQSYVFHYVALLDDLINTEKDVSILVKEKIITNQTGLSDQEVAKLINNLRLNAPTFPRHYYYYHISKDLHDYCNKWWHRSMASLRRDYFNTPWASISFVAATFLLILTLLQTIFSAPYIFHN